MNDDVIEKLSRQRREGIARSAQPCRRKIGLRFDRNAATGGADDQALAAVPVDLLRSIADA